MQHPIEPSIDFNSIRDAIESMLVGRDQLVDDRDMQNILIAILEYSRQQRAVCQNPYINNATNTWYVYDSNGNPYDTNVSAEGTIIRQTEAQSIEGDPRVTLAQIDPMKPNEMKMTIYIPKGERGESGSVVTIVDGYWYIDGVNTGVVATGEAPTISEDGYWVVGGEKTEFKAVGTDGRDGVDGQNGADGYSPTATVVKTGNTATIEITDKNGTTTATISDGTAGTLNTNNESAVMPGPGTESMSGNISLHKISKTGNYNDLLNKPDKSVYSDASDLVNINNWPSIHTIEMGRKVMYTASANGVASTAVLQYGSPTTTGKQEWSGSTGDYIKYVPLAANKEYILEVLITSFSLESTGVARNEYDISGVFFVKVRTGNDGYLSVQPELMSYRLKDERTRTQTPISIKKNQAFTAPFITYYLNKKVGTITYGGTTIDVTIPYGSGAPVYIDEVSGETYGSGMNLVTHVTVDGSTSEYRCAVTAEQYQHAVILGENNKAYINENATAEFTINGLKYPVTFTDRGPIGDYTIALTRDQNITIPASTNIANVVNSNSYICACDYEYGTNNGINIEVAETQIAIDNLETSFNENTDKIWVLSAPEVNGGGQRRLVIAITNLQNQGGGFDISAAIRVLKTTSVNRTYNYNDYDHIALP